MVRNSSPLHRKARHFQNDLIEKHLLEGLYVSIVPAGPPPGGSATAPPRSNGTRDRGATRTTAGTATSASTTSTRCSTATPSITTSPPTRPRSGSSSGTSSGSCPTSWRTAAASSTST